jgi:hypothetical protein
MLRMVEASTVLLRNRAALISKENTMKQHEKRFIIEVLDQYGDGWVRSGNSGLTGFFATRKEATAALAKGNKSFPRKYRVRQTRFD